MLTIIATVALCYIAAGIYILLLFDWVDSRKGWQTCDFKGQVKIVLTWPSFLYFIAMQDEIFVEIGDE